MVLFLVEFINTYSFLQERLEGVKEKLQKLEASVSNSSIFDDSDEKDNKLINEIDYVFFFKRHWQLGNLSEFSYAELILPFSLKPLLLVSPLIPFCKILSFNSFL